MPIDTRHESKSPTTNATFAATSAWSPLDAARSLELALAGLREAGLVAAVEMDARGAFPRELSAAVRECGFTEYFIPAEHGGRLQSIEELVGLARVLSRRDVTAAVALGASFLAALPVWLRGGAEQRQSAAGLLRRGEYLSFALSERQHGADLVAGDVTATRIATADASGWRIDGTKWLINNAVHASAATITARTGEGVRGLTLFFVPRARADERQWTVLPKIRTHGLRGSAFGGLVFTGLAATDADIVGRVGRGLPLLMETLQITRVLVCGFALGALDTCLRAVLDFAVTRRLYGAPIVDLEPVGRGLADAYVDLLIGETLAHAASRAAHVAPGQLPLMSACAKYLVPTLATDAIDALSVLLGARSYLAFEHWHGIVEKMRRDCAVTTLFDGSTPVNLNIIADHLPMLALARAGGTVPDIASELFVPDPPAPHPLDPDHLELVTEADAIVGGTDDVRTYLTASSSAVNGHHSTLEELLAWFDAEIAALDARVTNAPSGPDWRRSGESYDLAVRYSHLHAAGACARRWLALLPTATNEFVTRGTWLVACLRRLATRLGAPSVPFDDIDRAALARLRTTAEGRLLFSDFHVPLGQVGSDER